MKQIAATPDTESVAPVDQGNKARYSPAVLKISQEHGIDLTQGVRHRRRWHGLPEKIY